MALRYFDVETAEYRDCQQADLDQLMAIRTAYGRIQSRFAEDRATLVETMRAIRSKAGQPNEVRRVFDATNPVEGDPERMKV